jgi:hypothetical protein
MASRRSRDQRQKPDLEALRRWPLVPALKHFVRSWTTGRRDQHGLEALEHLLAGRRGLGDRDREVGRQKPRQLDICGRFERSMKNPKETLASNRLQIEFELPL